MSIRLLHLDSSILGGHSFSRSLSADVVAKLVASNPQIEVVYRDLAAEPIPHLSGGGVTATRGGMDPGNDTALRQDLALGEKVLNEFLAADIVVIGVAFHNFTISTQLKAWVDRIAVAGKTFRYTANGAEGLVGSKRVLLTIARGGYYSAGSTVAAMGHGESYLRGTLAFMGITAPEVIVAEGLNVGPEQRGAALAQARQRIAEVAAA